MAHEYELFVGLVDQKNLTTLFEGLYQQVKKVVGTNKTLSSDLDNTTSVITPETIDKKIYVGYQLFEENREPKKIMRGFCYENNILMATEIKIVQDYDTKVWTRQMMEKSPKIPQMGINEYSFSNNHPGEFSSENTSQSLFAHIKVPQFQLENLLLGIHVENNEHSYYLLGQTRKLSPGAEGRQRAFLQEFKK